MFTRCDAESLGFRLAVAVDTQYVALVHSRRSVYDPHLLLVPQLALLGCALVVLLSYQLILICYRMLDGIGRESIIIIKYLSTQYTYNLHVRV